MDAHLAQINIATLRAPMDHADTAPFAEGLLPVNASGDTAPGFVWRLQTEAGDATSISAFANPLTIVNLTVWESIAALRNFAYSGLHRDFFRRRAEWFVPGESRTALWWIPAGSLPTVDDAKQRLGFIDTWGPSPFAFRMGQQHPVLTIDTAPLDDHDAVTLITALDAELRALYPEPGANHFRLDPAEVEPGVGGFFIARIDGVPAGCCAYRMQPDGAAEVKRMFVAADARGTKLGAALLAVVEAAARRDGANRLVLETGRRQTAAVGLYERTGFEQVPCWGEYVATAATSLCMAKQL